METRCGNVFEVLLPYGKMLCDNIINYLRRRFSALVEKIVFMG